VDKQSIEWAMSQGAPLTCATCSHFHAGNMFCGKTTCGGPGVNRDFPDYDGPIPRDAFSSRCLVCGNAPNSLIIGLETKFSLCKKHASVFNHVGHNDDSKVRYNVQVIALP